MGTQGRQYIAVPVLMYHQIQPLRHQPPAQPGLVVDTKQFYWQMYCLRALGYHTLTLDELVQALEGSQPLPRRAVAITFDDGYYGVYRYAFPILQHFRFNATLFLIGEDFADSGHAIINRAFPVVDAAQVGEMLVAGIQIGSHSVSHRRLTTIELFEAEEEIIASKTILESVFGRRITTFSYPYGLYNGQLAEMVRRAGYACAVTTRFGHRHILSEQFTLRRIAVGSAQRLPEFMYRLRLAKEETV